MLIMNANDDDEYYWMLMMSTVVIGVAWSINYRKRFNNI